MFETRDNWHYTHNAPNGVEFAPISANPTLQLDPKAVSLCVENARHIVTSNTDYQLQLKKKELMDELMRRALEQNPDITAQLSEIQSEERRIHDIQCKMDIEAYHRWKEEQDEKRKKERHIRYDDKRNINALLGLRRSFIYQSQSRMGKIQMELDKYYSKYNIEPPKELLDELAKLKHAKELYLKRVKRDAEGRIIRQRYAG